MVWRAAVTAEPNWAICAMVRTLVRICDDPYDPVFSAPVPPVTADEATGLVRVYHLVWTG